MCVTCGGGHNGGGQSIDGGVGSREAPGVEAAHGGDVGGGGVGGDAGQLESGLSADQAGGERGVRLKVRRVIAWLSPVLATQTESVFIQHYSVFIESPPQSPVY